MSSSQTLSAFGRYLRYVSLIYSEIDLTGTIFSPLTLEAFSALSVSDQKLALKEITVWYTDHK